MLCTRLCTCCALCPLLCALHSALHIVLALQVVRVHCIEQAAICSLYCTTNYPMVSLLPEFLLSLPATHRQQWNLSTLSDKAVPTSHNLSNLAERPWQELYSVTQCLVLPGSAKQSAPVSYPWPGKYNSRQKPTVLQDQPEATHVWGKQNIKISGGQHILLNKSDKIDYLKKKYDYN